MKAVIFGLLIITFSMCSRVEDKPPVAIDYDKLKTYIAKNTRYFDPGFYKEEHVGLTYQIDSGRIVDKPASRTKIGKMPGVHFPGSFTVIYRDVENRELGRYRMWSPFYRRVESPGTGMGIQKVSEGRFEIPLPKNDQIATVAFMEADSILLTSNVRGIFSRLRTEKSRR
jgi:hypothetical protein